MEASAPSQAQSVALVDADVSLSAETPQTTLHKTQDVEMAMAGVGDSSVQDNAALNATTPAVPVASSPTTSSPLNVNDALSYLEEVKTQFRDQPHVYNRFLDIMKDFKAQHIDTPGVIERVSSLFDTRVDLIQGFNQFLPPGYRIECDRATGFVRVITPNGVTDSAGKSIKQDTFAPVRVLDATTVTNAPPPPLATSQNTMQNGIPSMARTTQSPAIHAQSLLPAQSQPSSGTEFGHAINFVNKIKQRFSDQPEVYKQFLEILQQYQKEGKPLQEVYSQVQVLFQDAADLLAEFKQFLPEPGSGNVGPSFIPMMPRTIPGPAGRMPARGGFAEDDRASVFGQGRIGFGPVAGSQTHMAPSGGARKKTYCSGQRHGKNKTIQSRTCCQYGQCLHRHRISSHNW